MSCWCPDVSSDIYQTDVNRLQSLLCNVSLWRLMNVFFLSDEKAFGKMDPKHKMLLQQHQKDIVRDLDVAYIIDELYTCEAITQDDFDHIVNLVSNLTNLFKKFVSFLTTDTEIYGGFRYRPS